MLLARVAKEKALPFEPRNPNTETITAMKTVRRGQVVRVVKSEKLPQAVKSL